MKDIIIIQDGENYHLFLGDTSVWLNADEMNRLQVAVPQFKAEQKPETYEAGRFYRFEFKGAYYTALLIEDCGGENLRFGEHVTWSKRAKKGYEGAQYSPNEMILSKELCTSMTIADEDDIHIFCHYKVKAKMEAVKDKANRFKMYDKVLVRNYEDECWFPAIFVKCSIKKGIPYKCLLLDTGASTDFRFCEPYEGNENAAYNDKEILPF